MAPLPGHGSLMQINYCLKDSEPSECLWISLSAHDLEGVFPSSNHLLFPTPARYPHSL